MSRPDLNVFFSVYVEHEGQRSTPGTVKVVPPLQQRTQTAVRSINLPE